MALRILFIVGVLAIVAGIFWWYEPESPINQAYSPNYDERPVGSEIDVIVLHATEISSIEKTTHWFGDARTKVSAHYTVGKTGRIVQHVPDEKRAWHAGESEMPDGRTKVNDFSIGIELVNLNDGQDPYPKEQIEALRNLIRRLVKRHPITAIVSHAAIARPPGRKSDPQGFDLSSLSDLLPGGSVPPNG